ncbi:hypothetical protein ACIQPR_15885 [Streptomyces sp. NPDC091280]|uniref:hypothetical protein n=1 Tax=Streptomyces sp. NPDC091280 TaxID=3365984 RepID=UPI00381BFD0D
MPVHGAQLKQGLQFCVYVADACGDGDSDGDGEGEGSDDEAERGHHPLAVTRSAVGGAAPR